MNLFHLRRCKTYLKGNLIMRTKKQDAGKTKTAETKAAAEVKETVSSDKTETKPETVKAEVPKKPAKRVFIKKETEKTPEEKPAVSAEKAAEDKPAAKRGPRKAAKIEEPAAEKKSRGRNTASVVLSAPVAEEKPAAKRAAKKPVTIETICGKVEKKIKKAVAAKFDKTIAVDIEVWGFEDGSSHKMFIEVKEGKVNVQPYSYNEKNFRVAINFELAVGFVNGKNTLNDLLNSDKFFAEGNIADAVKFASIF